MSRSSHLPTGGAWPPSSLIVLLAAVTATAPLAAQPTRHGGELQVNSYTTGRQDRPAVAMDDAGRFVVVWPSYGSPGTDNSGYSIQGQRYSKEGVPIGAQFQVNVYTTSSQDAPAVAADAAGNFVVVWHSNGSAQSDTDLESIQARRYAANGTPQGGQFQVNTYTTYSQLAPAVALDDSGDFVVVWESLGSPGNDSSGLSIQAQRYAANGTPQGGQFQVNTYTTNTQELAAVAADALRNFVVVWQSSGSPGSDTSGTSIQGRRYAADGTPQGVQFQVNSHTTGTQAAPSVAADAARNFVVVWDSSTSPGSDISGYSVQAQRYAASGTPQGSQFQVNNFTTGQQFLATVAADDRRDFVVAWHGTGSNGTDTSGYSVHARTFRATGAAVGGEVQVNTYTTGAQAVPAVAAGRDGDFVVAWQSAGSSGSDSDGFSVQAQLYDEIFRDGVEGGSAARWSTVNP
jgi:hypothetical protein